MCICQNMDKAYIEATKKALEKLLPDENMEVLNQTDMGCLVKSRPQQAHKGDFGHALLYAGSHGMAGASILSARACLRSGVGLLTVCTPSCNNDILQISVPEAMTIPADDLYANTDLSRYNAIGAGPGLGKADSQTAVLDKLLKTATCPMVLDADALNIISVNSHMLEYVPAGSVMTPHPGELARLTGICKDWDDMIAKALDLAENTGITVIVKGAPSVTVTPQRKAFINTTGNNGMATAGSGDVLTGIVLALLAQGYCALHAAVVGAFIHGLAGDKAAQELSVTAMTSADIISHLPHAWLEMTENK